MTSRVEDLRFRERLVERLGAETADELLERLPLMPVREFATKADVTQLRGEIAGVRGEISEVRGEIAGVRGEISEVRGEVSDLRGEMRSEIAEVRGEIVGVRVGMAELRTEVADAMRIQTWYMAGLLLTGIGASTAITAALLA